MRSDATFFVFADLGAFEYHGTLKVPAASLPDPLKNHDSD